MDLGQGESLCYNIFKSRRLDFRMNSQSVHYLSCADEVFIKQ